MTAEILSPCGGAQSVEAAVYSGCDAVYVGSKSFSARQNARNFTSEELGEAVLFCHKNGVKVYQAINTLMFNSQLKAVEDELKAACEVGVDGIIIQDMAVARIAKRVCPEMPLHASTQLSVHTAGGMEACRRLGFCRAVAARELSLEKISELAAAGVELEVFVHGALCMSVSGQCYMSAVIGSRSANRGLCAQACRLPFSAAKGCAANALSLKDMCQIDWIKKLENAGVASLKIEGRMKRPEYVAAATNACKSAQSGNEYDRELLRAVFSRNGFTDGYIASKLGGEMFGMRSREDAELSADALPKLHELYRRPYKRFTVDFDIKIKRGTPVTVSAKSSDGFSAEVVGEAAAEAVSRETDLDFVQKQLSKLGSTAYLLGKISAEIDGGLAVPASSLNELRRRAVDALDLQRVKSFSGAGSAGEYAERFPARKKTTPKLRACICDVSQLDGLLGDPDIELVSLPLAQIEKLTEIPEKLSAAMPRYDIDERDTLRRLEALKKRGLKHITATNIAHILPDTGLKIHADFGLNITNSAAAAELVDLGAYDITASFEMTAAQLSGLGCRAAVGAIVYGKLPVMLTANCPIKAQLGSCSKCTGALWDRTGRKFEVKCSKTYTEILNSETLWLADRLGDFDTLDFHTLLFYKETPDQIREIIRAYRNGEKPGGQITRGLYYRGLM